MAPPRKVPDGTIFAHKIARERQSLFGQKCEPDPVQRVARCLSDGAVDANKNQGTPFGITRKVHFVN
jgi:hypothetical protein